MRHTKLLLLALFVAAATPAFAKRELLQAYLEMFPPYGCTRDPDQSRFRVDPAYTVNGNKVCFTARVVPCARPGSACCKPDVDFNKLEFFVGTTCKGSIDRVTVDGERAQMPTFELYGAKQNKALYKMTNLNLTTRTAEGKQICINLGGPCPTMQDLCPQARLRLARHRRRLHRRCCNQNLSKIEWWTKDSCRGSVRAAYLDGVKVDRQWAKKTFKLPQLNIAQASIPPEGLELCIELISTASCSTLSTFCFRGDKGMCTYSMFNSDKKCCPINTYAALPSRRLL
ncbi:hypothetical protein VOLCADRAFT_91964 [Volvox carteri f. nagariensis]|uniref:Pherophorin domain-containing protein n=1 Tax=Volvox carteri f. nagariensis TaxID=3068 RepID=D8TYE9_VOLCA|nr:uncharacterized protein VOLCADRAFT_91964 [Volvox carteri f. nagariensis]EFJ47544.1 hypothetical protein VOLCADRAFT_91964 [Volvox carteri f. nagariensis]|eukprot:XP_002951368.1 hypothetical protein VOLCADRAFT_91964 [Volvox carteri f. nagariensis]